MTDNIQDLLSIKLARAIANPLFPEVDSQLRSGKHIGQEYLDNYSFLADFQHELDSFYRRYNVELIRAPEGFFYLRPKATTLIARSVLSELEMLVGKVLCYLYLSPERLAQQGIFTVQEVHDELINLADETKLLKAINLRAGGSDLDKQKLAEKVRSAISRLRRLGMIHAVGDQHSGKFTISESVFRFGAEVRSGDDPLEAQLRLIREGEAATAQSLQEEKNGLKDNMDQSAVENEQDFENEEEGIA
ncbi:chromosome partition protein MukE [Histophilus somni]|uniref:Chromosome partition protein MukE n=1 Tax=Histophilus somni TaxID=731 RepID=A0AAX2S3R4_HISSO|nr:chromosome partition protein MukE [Histophilus somni]QEH08831.1 chromosome partition protein MukE [Histophilus somni]QEH12588.1 chromosome partition protein MukE [Histophilus somni]QEH17908.1 chromosome partition protein MukE [Histophilus somni]QEH25102.1 chromosome partition protein MukE [Histophilus somni]QEH27070.1 chromosome partition protein MukE [Histophilus somni]